MIHAGLPERHELWKSDGTEAGTALVTDVEGNSFSFDDFVPLSRPPMSNMTNVNGTLYFTAIDRTSGTKSLWKTDGTSAGTVLVKTGDSLSTEFRQLTCVNNQLFFEFFGALWKSDGTQAGTILVKSGTPADPFFPVSFKAVGNALFFMSSSRAGGGSFDLWVSDGTSVGTVLISTFFDPRNLTAVDGTLYLIVKGRELWRSDGTASGTFALKSFANSSASPIQPVTGYKGAIYFNAVDPATGLLRFWKSDGTAEGTVILGDGPAANPNFMPNGLSVAGNTLFFSADDGIHGRELWQSDGTTGGTVLFQDINPGSPSSSAGQVIDANGKLIFMADDGVHGNELWMIQSRTAVSISSPASGSSIGTEVPITLSGSFVDDTVSHSHTAQWTFTSADVSPIVVAGTVSQAGGSGTTSANVTFTVPGVYDVALKITDDTGAIDASGRTADGQVARFTIYDSHPTATIDGPTSGARGQSLTFNLGATDLTPGDPAAGFTYSIDWGDGTPVQTINRSANNGAGMQVEHIFPVGGRHVVNATAEDQTGLISTPGSQTVSVSARPTQLDVSFDQDGRQTTDVITSISGADGAAGSRSVAIMPNGKIVVVGDSNHYGGSGIDFAVVRYNPDGSLDTTFGGGTVLIDLGGDDWPEAVAVMEDGRIVVAGHSQRSTGIDFAVARLLSDGTPDDSFDYDGMQLIDFGSAELPSDDIAYGMALRSDGGVVVAGWSDAYDGDGIWVGTDFAVAQLLSNGHLDTSFSADGRQTIDFSTDDHGLGVVVDSDNRIVVVGSTDLLRDFPIGTGKDFAVARLKSDGCLDPLFGTGGKQTIDFTLSYQWALDEPWDVALKPDGGLILVGVSYQEFTGADFAVAWLDSWGQPATSFGDNGKKLIDFLGPFALSSTDFGTSVALQPDGKVVLAGSTWAYYSDTGSDFAVVRLTAAGQLDADFGVGGIESTDFGSSFDDYGGGVAVQPDGKIVVAGWTNDSTGGDFAVARYLGDDQVQVAVNPATVSADLQTIVAYLQDSTTYTSLPPVILLVDATTIDSTLDAVAALTPNQSVSQPVEVVVDLGGNPISGQTISVPDGVILTFQNGIFKGASPALIVEAGVVFVLDSVLSNATNAPTILVTGGSLTIRRSLISESMGFSRAAIEITGGSIDLGTSIDSGGNTIQSNGAGELIHIAGSNSVSALGNTWQQDSVTLSTYHEIETRIYDGFDAAGIGLVSFDALDALYQGMADSVVTNTNDSGPGSFRQAILFANANPGLDAITFNIPGGGVQTIAPVTALPMITNAVIIDGFTQLGASPGNLRIELSGAQANSPATYGLWITAGSSAVRGLVINQFSGGGILLCDGDGNFLEGNYIGTDAAGNVARSNGGGILVFAGSDNNTIGGTTPAARNIISGNSLNNVQISDSGTTGNTVSGNYIGTNAAGTAGITSSGTTAGVAITAGATSNTVGGSAVGAGNLVSWNSYGVHLLGSATTGNVIAGNIIGLNAAGTAGLPNFSVGIFIDGASSNRIGTNADGTNDALERNIISANPSGMTLVHGATNNVIAGNYIGLGADGRSALGTTSQPGIILLDSPNNTIGGVSTGAGNVISASAGAGVDIRSNGTQVLGNRIGTDASGTLARGNGLAGVVISGSDNNVIGGSIAGARNIISGNSGRGVIVTSSGSGNMVQGNSIGIDVNGANLGNGLDGIWIFGDNTTVGGWVSGAGNIIAFSGGDGVRVTFNGANNRIRGNSIYSNAGLGIDLGADGVTANDSGDTDSGPNARQNFPVLTAVIPGASSRFQGTLNSTANSTITLDFYASAAADPSGYGEGQHYLGSTTATTDSNGNARFDVLLAAATAAGEQIAATATSTTGSTSEFSLVLAVAANSSPVIVSDNCSVTAPEGTTAVNTGTYSDPNTGDNVTLTASVGTITKTGTSSGSWTWSFNTTDGPAQSQTVTVTANDGHGGITTTSFGLIVNNVSPSVTITGPTDGVHGQLLAFNLSAVDPSFIDQAAGFTFRIDWDGNGTVDQTAIGASGTTVAHTFTDTGSYTIRVTAEDKDHGVSVLTTFTVSVAAVLLQADPCDPGTTALFVGGTMGNDTIVLSPSGSSGAVVVTLNGTSLGAFQPTGRIVVYAQAGDDDVQVAGGVAHAAWLYGGDGNDRLKGGGGNNVLFGGNGDDLLVGGNNRDLIVGGEGADRIVGNAEEDILIAGRTAYDNDQAALCAILSEWTSSRRFSTRVANLAGSGTGSDFANRFNGNHFLRVTDQAATTTVFDDGAQDVLTGSAGTDWFFANLRGNGVLDKITDLNASEFATDLDFIGGP